MMKICAIVCNIILLMTISVEKTDAQRVATTVMEVRVEVVSGATIERNDQSLTFAPNIEDVTYGDFSIYVPNGGKLLAKSSGNVELVNGNGTWMMQSRMDVEERDNGIFRLTFTSIGNQNYGNGMHKGVQIATIEYL
jgi:hypothetical protein